MNDDQNITADKLWDGDPSEDSLDDYFDATSRKEEQEKKFHARNHVAR